MDDINLVHKNNLQEMIFLRPDSTAHVLWRYSYEKSWEKCVWKMESKCLQDYVPGR